MSEMLSFTNHLLKLHKKMCKIVQSKIKKNNHSLTTIELLYLWKAAENEFEKGYTTTDEMEKTGEFILNQLLFTLNALEKKTLLVLESIKPDGKSFNIKVSDKGKKTLQSFEKVKFPPDLFKSINHIEQVINEIKV